MSDIPGVSSASRIGLRLYFVGPLWAWTLACRLFGLTASPAAAVDDALLDACEYATVDALRRFRLSLVVGALTLLPFLVVWMRFLTSGAYRIAVQSVFLAVASSAQSLGFSRAGSGSIGYWGTMLIGLAFALAVAAAVLTPYLLFARKSATATAPILSLALALTSGVRPRLLASSVAAHPRTQLAFRGLVGRDLTGFVDLQEGEQQQVGSV